jgi:hypothetical protein
MARVVRTFYEGSLEKAVASMLQTRDGKLSKEELERLGQLIEQAKNVEP